MDILAELTPAQIEAVTHVDGPLLVLAGAGSGKTRVITRRIAYLMSQGVPASQILAITFTNKAAGEMRDRTHALVPGQRRPLVTTFHSFCARMLREYAETLGLDPSYVIYDTSDQKATMKRALARLNLDTAHYNPDKLLARISTAKNRLQRAKDFAAIHRGDWSGRRVSQVYEEYEAILRDASALDFDDLLLEMALGLKNNDELRRLLQDRFRYILIDEYQDTNHAQYVIARDLTGDRHNICATGDPDQSIYGWRGAEVSNILDFEKDFPDARVVLLEQNYRSTKIILRAASAVIRHNRKRKDKTLTTDNPDGLKVRVVQTDDQEAEADSVARRIKAMVGDKFTYGDVAVFVRTGAQTRALEDAFRRASPSIPYEIVRGSSFYDRKEIRDVIAYLQVLHNPADVVHMRRIINTPPRGIGDKTRGALESFARHEGIDLLEAAHHAADIPELPARGRGAVNRFATLMDRLTDEPVEPIADLIETVLTETGYRDSLEGDDDAPGRLENLDELVTLAANFDREAAEDETIPPGLAGFLEQVNLSSEQDAYEEEADRVSVMTLHAAKGLEFPCVFIPGVEEGLLPHIQSMETASEIEEERRLFFVGMTRAQEVLTLLHARFRQLRGRTERCTPSSFLAELPAETVKLENERTGTAPTSTEKKKRYAEPGAESPGKARRDPQTGLAPGDKVRHPTFGVGRVLRFRTSGGRTMVVIRFGRIGEKTLDPKYARLDPVAAG